MDSIYTKEYTLSNMDSTGLKKHTSLLYSTDYIDIKEGEDYCLIPLHINKVTVSMKSLAILSILSDLSMIAINYIKNKETQSQSETLTLKEKISTLDNDVNTPLKKLKEEYGDNGGSIDSFIDSLLKRSENLKDVFDGL